MTDRTQGQPQLHLRASIASIAVELREGLALDRIITKTQANSAALDLMVFSGRHSLCASLAGLSIVDCNEAASLLPVVLETSPVQELNFLTLRYEKNPAGAALDHLLEVHTQPLTFVLNWKLIERVLDVFKEELESETAYHLQQSAEQRVDETTARLRSTARRAVVGVKIELTGLKLLVPNAVDASVSALMALELGSLALAKNFEQVVPDFYTGYADFNLDITALRFGFLNPEMLPDLTAALASYKGGIFECFCFCKFFFWLGPLD